MEENKPKGLENYILPILKYVGLAGSIILSIAYICIVIVLILGFEFRQDLTQTVLFAIVNGVVGLLIMTMLKIQGISFAKDKEENKEILDKYYTTKTKDKKFQSINKYWLKSTIADILFKAITIIASTAGIIYIAIQGSHDYMLLLLAVVNLLMFICFGILALNSSYEFFNNKHIPYIVNQLEIIEEEKSRQPDYSELYDEVKEFLKDKINKEKSNEFKIIYESVYKFLEQNITNS